MPDPLPSSPNVDKRVERSRASVLREAYALLIQAGVGGVSVDEISRRSGVSKTTIYRHWPSRSALLLDACSKLGSTLDAPETGTLEGDLDLLVGYFTQELRVAGWATILPSIIDAAERDPDVAQMQAALNAGFARPFLQTIERAVARGELRSEPTPAEMTALILGPLFYRRWFSKEPIEESFVRTVLGAAITSGRPDAANL